MRHRKKTVKLGRKAEHRKALLANQVCSLIEHTRIRTTLAKAKAVRPLAEKMVTLGKKGSLHARRTALAVLIEWVDAPKADEPVEETTAAKGKGKKAASAETAAPEAKPKKPRAKKKAEEKPEGET